jgi:Fe2+ or Zn2+ uptake regulation protein
MNKKQKYIKLDKEKVKEIAEIKNVSTVTVYAALKFQTQSPLAMLIRAWALNNGGVLFEEKENHYSEVKNL